MEINIEDYPENYPEDEPNRRCPSIDKAKKTWAIIPKLALMRNKEAFKLGRKNIENRILLIGSGNWSKNYIKTIQQIDSSELVLHLPARKALIEILKDKNIFKNKIEKEK